MLDAYKELVPVLYGENGVKIATYAAAAHVMCFRVHWHDRIELLRILSGQLDIYLNDEHITVVPGQTVIIMPHMIHCGFAGEEGVSYDMIAFDLERFCNTTIASAKYLTPLLEQKVAFSHVTDHPGIAGVLEELVRYFRMSDEHHPLCTIGKIYELIGLLYRYCASDAGRFYKTDSRFSMVLEYINHHYTENITTKSVSRKFGYVENYFCRRFKEATGITAMKYIKILRLELAQKLLRESEKDIRSISLQCGFTDISYFSNCFRQHLGLTPTEFRNSELV